MAGRPVLDDLELELVQKIDSDQDQELVQTSVPGVDGDFLASQGRRATRFTLTGTVAGDDAKEDLKKLREKFAITEPVAFVSDISTATKVDQVLIEEMGVRELAGRPNRFEYSFTLREFKPAPPPEEIPPPPPPPPPPVRLDGCLEVEVRVEDDPDFDFSSVTVTVSGLSDKGTAENRTLTKRSGNLWTEDPMEPGTYTATAITQVPEPMTGSAEAVVVEGECRHVIITLRRGVRIGNTYVIHYRFDKSFVEPCLRSVLREVANRASTGPAEEKLLIVGHTDLTGSDEYNQSLSERRARGVFAFLTYGLNPAAAVAEWNELRRQQLTSGATINDNWGTRQYQYMLQDLSFYNNQIDGDHGNTTTAAVRHFQTVNGLPATGFLNDATWPVLIDAYLRQDGLRVPPEKFLKNCDPETLKWLGCGELDPPSPELNVDIAKRQNRRTELVFTTVSQLPCEVPKPFTFDKPSPGVVGSSWCLGPQQGPARDPRRMCFLHRIGEAPRSPGSILIQPANPATTRARGRMRFEDGSPARGVRFVLIAPDGEFMNGEVPSGARRGEPNEGITDNDGRFAFERDKGVGIWILEVQASVLVRLEGDPPARAKGNVVCKRLDGSSDFDVILTSRPTSFEIVDANNVDQTIERIVFGQPFLIRADIPGETRDEITVELMSYLIRR